MTQLEQEHQDELRHAVDAVAAAINIEGLTPLTAALKIAELRQQAKDIERELEYLATYLEPHGRQEWEDGEYKYTARISRRETVTIDEGKLKFAYPHLYNACAKVVIDKALVKEMVNDGQAPNPELFMSTKKGRPFVTIVSEPISGEETN